MCGHWRAVVRKIFVVKLYSCKIFLYIFCVRKYFCNEKKRITVFHNYPPPLPPPPPPPPPPHTHTHTLTVTLYSCPRMGTNCAQCISVPSAYNCSHCGASSSCFLQESCVEGGLNSPSQVEECGTPVIEDVSGVRV